MSVFKKRRSVLKKLYKSTVSLLVCANLNIQTRTLKHIQTKKKESVLIILSLSDSEEKANEEELAKDLEDFCKNMIFS